jgi:hypothetical protein
MSQLTLPLWRCLLTSQYCVIILNFHSHIGSRNSSVGIATRYGPGIEPRWGRDFPHLSSRLWGPPSLLYNGHRFFPGGKAAGAWRWPTTASSAEVKKRVELYLFPLWAFVACSKVNFTLHKMRSHNHCYHSRATVLSVCFADTSVAVSYVVNIKLVAMEA